MNKKKKILVVTPNNPFRKKGACEQDRARGIEQLIRLGYDVRVIVKIPTHDEKYIEEVQSKLCIPIFKVSYGLFKSRDFAESLQNSEKSYSLRYPVVK